MIDKEIAWVEKHIAAIVSTIDDWQETYSIITSMRKMMTILNAMVRDQKEWQMV